MATTILELSAVQTTEPRRVVLLGASNLTRGMATVFDEARRRWGGPLELLVASGHGRSYGRHSQVLGRRLPGIQNCGLWQALENRPSIPTAALVTDIGNDLLYEVPVPQVAEWVETCVARLQARDAQVIMTGIPTGNLEHLSPRRFRFFRTLFHPLCRLTLDEVRKRAADLNRRLEDIAERRQVSLIAPPVRWYGLDPIHIRRQVWRQAWNEVFQAWESPLPLAPPRVASLVNWLHLRSLPPERRWLFGREQHRAQPIARLTDGTTLSLY